MIFFCFPKIKAVYTGGNWQGLRLWKKPYDHQTLSDTWKHLPRGLQTQEIHQHPRWLRRESAASFWFVNDVLSPEIC
jgi:hypothetical protein